MDFKNDFILQDDVMATPYHIWTWYDEIKLDFSKSQEFNYKFVKVLVGKASRKGKYYLLTLVLDN